MDLKPMEKVVETTSSVDSDAPYHAELYDPSKESIWTRLGVNFESFKRTLNTTGGQVIAGASNVQDLEKVLADAPMLQQKMKPRHLQMIAVGSSTGTGLFVGSSSVLHHRGPAGVLIAWLLIGVMLINVTQALSEIPILYPVSGGFYTLSAHFLDPTFAFAMGWNYVLQWAAVLLLKSMVAGTTVQYWGMPLAGWITIFYVVIVITSVFGTLGFTEEEFWSSCLKLFVVVMFIFIGIVCICGSGPKGGEYDHYISRTFWKNPSPFAAGFKGICTVFVGTVAFSFELVCLAASETPNPRETMPAAVKGTFWHITIIYVTSLIIIGLLIPWNEPRLLSGGGAAASPFIIALNNAKIKGLNYFVNITICISVLSFGLSCIYAGSHMLTALAETGYTPKIFAYVAILLFRPLGYVNVTAAGDTICGHVAPCLVGVIYTFLLGIDLGGVYGSWFGIILVLLVMIAQFYVAVWPVGGMSSNPKEVATKFNFSAYLAFPMMILFYIIGYAWKCTLPL
ncbi:hypothetical protein K443DRAFT_12126 [Laccaria amethystina LaAM-08-1]|uniref:Amino acid permease/ SLC12A domain-containing protein n=1 Tax=Laccaria amethystina LaAM-08-1 TaxID=1095629 RepID=A0A0C9WZP1_9AGAR|nr:hypothetical protein K443DRAFT_12126 [Laccaria amethystina LaAM-08-1]